MPFSRTVRSALAAAAATAALSALFAPSATAAPVDLDTNLTVEVYDDRLSTTPSRTYRLTCSPDGGIHPDPRAACDAIRNSPGTIKPVPPAQNCLTVIFGPQRARVHGLLFGSQVVGDFKRVNTCEEARWKAWLPVWG